MKAFTLSEHTANQVWQLTTDGYGRTRREYIGDPDLVQAYVDLGHMDPPIDITGPPARALLRVEPANPTYHADYGALALTMNLMTYMHEQLTTVTPGSDADVALALTDGRPGAPAIPIEMVDELTHQT